MKKLLVGMIVCMIGCSVDAPKVKHLDAGLGGSSSVSSASASSGGAGGQ
jgi:hypothetical protein